MSQWLRWGFLFATVGLSACAGAGESPTVPDMIFPLPYLIKQRHTTPLPAYGAKPAPAMNQQPSR